jgi:hypothetical protein
LGFRLDTREEIGLYRYDEPLQGRPIRRFTEYARAHRRGETPEWNTRTPRDQWDAIRAGLAALGSLTGAV